MSFAAFRRKTTPLKSQMKGWLPLSHLESAGLASVTRVQIPPSGTPTIQKAYRNPVFRPGHATFFNRLLVADPLFWL
jgi:hypothetical protein